MGVHRVGWSSRMRASAAAPGPLSRLFCFTYCPYNDVWIAIGKNGLRLWWSTGYRARGIVPPPKNRKGCVPTCFLFCFFLLFQVVLVQGRYLSFLPLCSRNEPVFLATCTPVAMPETRECVVQGATNVFTSIHSMDMRYIHVDSK